MKYLSDYTKEAQTKLYTKTGAFWAFGDDQFNEQKKDGVTYKNFGSGLVVPANKCRDFIHGYDRIIKDGIKADIKDNGLESIIERELHNYECFLTNDISDCVDALDKYPVTIAQIKDVFNSLRNSVNINY